MSEAASKAAGAPAARAARAARLGRLGARERLEALVDTGSFWELEAHVVSTAPISGPDQERPEGDAMLCGFGRVDGREIAVLATDPSVRCGAIGERGARKASELIGRAVARGVPLVLLADSEGARVHEGVAAVNGSSWLLERHAFASGRIPLLSATLGLAGGAAGYAVALCDLNVAVEGRSFAFLTGPQVIRAVTGEEVGLDAVGGTDLHAARTGLLHGLAEDDRAAIAWLRRALGYLPPNAWSLPPAAPPCEPAGWREGLVPEQPRAVYDVHEVLAALCDPDSFFELSPNVARNLLTGFARFRGAPVGVIASQPKHLGGVLDTPASVKGARFVRLCLAFNLPIVTFADSPGFLPGARSEQTGLLLHGAKLISAYAEAREQVPVVALILRKSCGAASVLSATAHVVLGLPGAQVQGMGVDGLMRVAFGLSFEGLDAEQRRDAKEELAAFHEAPLAAFRGGFAHRRVEPAEAREALLRALEACPPPRPAERGGRKLANLPL